MRYIVWLLVPLQGQKEAVTERGLEFFNNSLTYNLETNIIYKRQNVDYNLTLCEITNDFFSNLLRVLDTVTRSRTFSLGTNGKNSTCF